MLADLYRDNKAGIGAFLTAFGGVVFAKIDGGATLASLAVEDYFTALYLAVAGGAAGKAVHKSRHPSHGVDTPKK